MINWQPHTRVPDLPGQTAVIAVKCTRDEPDDVDSYLLPDLYLFDRHHGCWITETTGPKLRHTEYWWLPEGDLLETLT